MSHPETAGGVRAATLSTQLLLVALLVSPGDIRAAAPAPDVCRRVDAPHAEALMRVPFAIVDGRIYVEARVNGKGPFRFAVDTGASGMARADASLVDTLDLTIQGQDSSSDGVQTATVDRTRLESLEIGGLVRHNLDVITRDYRSKSGDAAFAGIVAREFFADGLLTIDYPRRTLSFSRSHVLSPGEGGVLAYERAFRIPVTIGDLVTQGQLDTGANVAFLMPTSMYAKVSSGPLQVAGRGQLTNGAIDTQRATIRGPFRVGGAHLFNVEVRVADRYPELLIGAHALQNAVVMIDQRSKSVAVCDRTHPKQRTVKRK